MEQEFEPPLLPCPFCGADAEHIHISFGDEVCRCTNPDGACSQPVRAARTTYRAADAWNDFVRQQQPEPPLKVPGRAAEAPVPEEEAFSVVNWGPTAVNGREAVSTTFPEEEEASSWWRLFGALDSPWEVVIWGLVGITLVLWWVIASYNGPSHQQRCPNETASPQQQQGPAPDLGTGRIA